MDGRTYSFECPDTSTTNMSSYSANSTSNLSLNPGLFRQGPQGAPSVFDNAYTPGPHPSIQSTLLQVVHEPHPAGSPFADDHQEGLKIPVRPLHPSGSLCCTTFIKSIYSSQQGYESVGPVVSLIPNDDITPASVDQIRNWPQEGVSMSVSLGHTHQSTPVHPTSSDVSAPSALPVISCGQTVVQDKERRVPKRPHRFQKTLGPAEKPGVSRGGYSCSICNLDYTQSQGLARHEREKHRARLCIYCREFAWGRPYLFRKHLVKRHPGIDPDAAIDEAARTRRGVTIRRRYPPLPQVPIPTPKCDSWDRAESQSRPNQLTSSPARPSTVTRLSPVFLPEMAYDSQSESTEPPNKETHRQEGALSSELLNADDERAASPSTGEHAEAATNLDMSARTVQLWFKDKKQSVSPVGFTAVDGPSNLAPALAPVPTPTPPLNGYGSPVVVSPIVEHAEHRYSCHSPLASVVERSGRMPSPPLPIGCNWADICLAGTQPGPISYI